MLSKADRELIHKNLDKIELKEPNYLQGFEVKNNSTFYKGKPITDFSIKIVMFFTVEEPDQDKSLYCILQYFTRGDPDELDERRMIKVDVSKLDSPAYMKKVLPKSCLSICGVKKLTEYLSQSITRVLFDMNPVKAVHAQQGPNHYNGIPCFGYGNMSICADETIDFYNDSAHELKDHSEYTEGFSWLVYYMKCSWTEPIDLLTDLSTKVLYLFSDSDRRFALWSYGKTAVGKTVSANLIYDQYINHDNCRKLSSDKDSINTADIPGSTFYVDDFNKTRSNRILEANMEKVEDLIGRFQSTAPTIRKGVRCDISGNLAITSEVKPKNKSTANRCLISKKTSRFVPGELTYLQKNSAQVIILEKDFIRYILENEKVILSNMNGYLDICMPPADDYEGMYETNNRVQRNKQTLKVTLMLFMKFLRMRSGLPNECLDMIEKRFNDSIELCVCETYNVLKAYISNDEQSKYVTDLAYMIWLPQQDVRVTDSFTIFTQHTNSYNQNKIGKYIFFYDKYENDVCIHSDTLISLLYDEKLGLTTEQFRRKLFSDLKEAGVIDFCGKSSTYPIKNHDRKKIYIHLRLGQHRTTCQPSSKVI